jgi:CRISPR-associated protein Cst2
MREVKKVSNSTNKTETLQESNQRKFIVLDVVFYGSSLNYDQGTGNYQELKKITKWDGKQHTLVSRYALRYSLLKTGEDLGLWKNAPGTEFERAGERRAGEGVKSVIQPSMEALLSGKLLEYPEFDLFGYLITSTTPQNFREAPVKISHAISMTPYSYDSHFSGNLGLARRMVEAGKANKMDVDLFTVEEHQTYYVYTIVIDEARIGKYEVYLAKNNKGKGSKNSLNEKEKLTITSIEVKNDKIIIKRKKNNKEEFQEVPLIKDVKCECREEGEVFVLKYSLAQTNLATQEKKEEKEPSIIKERVKALIKAVLNLNRQIKGRNEFLQPKLLVLGVYNGEPYQSYKDRIILANEYEETYEETVEPKTNDSVKIIKRAVKLEKPTFKIFVDKEIRPEVLNENEVIKAISLQDSNEQSSSVRIFYAPEIKVVTQPIEQTS